MGEEPDGLEGAGDAVVTSRCGRGRNGASVPLDRRPTSGRTKPEMTLNSVVLPAPLGPITPTTDPRRHVEGDVVERHEAAEADADPAYGQSGQCGTETYALLATNLL